jgi:hypothetical protein
MMKTTVLAVIIVFGGGCISEVRAADQPSRVAFFGFQLINTSLQSTTPEEGQRILVLDDMFQRKLNASGRFQLIPIPPDLDDAIAGAPIANCNGCERDFALRIGADLAAWGTVQKVSNLILNINVYMEDVRAKKMVFVKSATSAAIQMNRGSAA